VSNLKEHLEGINALQLVAGFNEMFQVEVNKNLAGFGIETGAQSALTALAMPKTYHLQ